MGCDIHAQIERKYPEDSWEAYTIWNVARDFEIDRNYKLFSYLAGVRNNSNVTPIVEPRGMPSRVSWTTEKEYKEWDGDAHTESWLTFEELEELPDEFKKDDFYQVMKVLAKTHGKKNLRLVFWFDN